MEYVRVRCVQCKLVYKVKSQLAGKKVKCSSCQQILLVPQQADPEEVAAKSALAESQMVTTADKADSHYGVAEATSSPLKRNRREATSAKVDEEEASGVRPIRKTRSSRQARTTAWKKVWLGMLFLAMATTITLATGLSSVVLDLVLPLSALRALHNIRYPILLISQALQIAGFGFVLFVPARIPKHLTVGVLFTCLAISIVGESLTLWAWLTIGPANRSEQLLEKHSHVTKKLNDPNPEVRAKANEEINQLNEELEKMTSKLGSYLFGTLLLLPILLISLAVNYLLFPFWLKALARILHVESLVEAYMDFYKVATALFVVSMLVSMLMCFGVPYWVLVFITLPLGFIAGLVTLGMQYAYLKLLGGFREEIAERI